MTHITNTFNLSTFDKDLQAFYHDIDNVLLAPFNIQLTNQQKDAIKQNVLKFLGEKPLILTTIVGSTTYNTSNPDVVIPNELDSTLLSASGRFYTYLQN